MMDILGLCIAALLGFFGAGAMVLLQYYNDKLKDNKKKVIVFLLLGAIAAFVSALAGDGAALVGPIGYFAIGALGPGMLEEAIEGYAKLKSKKEA